MVVLLLVFFLSIVNVGIIYFSLFFFFSLSLALFLSRVCTFLVNFLAIGGVGRIGEAVFLELVLEVFYFVPSRLPYFRLLGEAVDPLLLLRQGQEA